MKFLSIFMVLGFFLFSGCASKSTHQCGDGKEGCSCSAEQLAKGECKECAAGKACEHCKACKGCKEGKCDCHADGKCKCEKGKCNCKK